jgi:hypothetical protein
MRRFHSFDEFWPFYASEHAHPLNRALHFIGSSASLLCGAAALFSHLVLLPVALSIGYGMAWIGHFLVEKNRPAAFRHPWWSFRADWKMWLRVLKNGWRARLV